MNPIPLRIIVQLKSATVLLVAASCIVFSGCTLNWPGDRQKGEKSSTATDIVDLPNSAAFRDTVAQYTTYQGLRKMAVRGYGVITGLGTKGSREAPPRVRDQVLEMLYKDPAFSATEGSGRVSPESILNSLDTSIVTVQGEIPAAALAGDRFDVYIEALPGTQTTSLEGGRLQQCDLNIFRVTESGTAITGKAIGRAAGPVFLNPFATDKTAATPVELRRGLVPGGGVVKEDRRVHLILSVPSYQMARAIMSRINERFPAMPKVADAETPSVIKIHVPENHRSDPVHFLAVVRHLYLSSDRAFLDQRAQDLAAELRKQSAPWAEIALAFEGLGRNAIPIIQEFYTDARPEIQFYTAAAGLRMGDDLALEVIRRHALDAGGKYREQAIAALGVAREMSRAAAPLQALLGDEDPRIRVAAYLALVERDDAVIESSAVGGDNFILDHVPAAGENFIYATRTQTPRIALMGRKLLCNPPAFYRHRDESVVVNAQPNDRQLTVVRKAPRTGRMTEPLPTSTDLWSFIRMLGDDPQIASGGQMEGLALNYSTVVAVLHALCEQGAVNAKFMLEQPSGRGLFGPSRPQGRPESELSEELMKADDETIPELQDIDADSGPADDKESTEPQGMSRPE